MAESNDTYLASIKGDQIAEGKTKVIYKIKDNPKHVLIVSKNSITAGDGAKKDELPGKGKFSTITTSNVFRLWTLAGLPTHYIQQESEDSFRALSCHMIPLEVIVRRVAAGSYVKRNPHITQGTRMDPLVVEFTFKDDANHDPLVTDEEIIKMNIQKGPITVDAGVIATLKEVATKAFAVVEKAWSKLDVTLVDYKVEFGVTPEGQVILGDVVDNDSWRVWPHGDPSLMKDKQIYRNLPGKLTEKDAALLSANYQWVAEQSNRFIDSILEPLSVGPLVGIIMGSQSDWDTMKNAADILTKLGVPFETRIVSAHRTPERLFAYAKTAKSRGLKVIIAGAGGAAHLPGMVASLTSLPVLGIPVQSRALSGMDSLLSIVQMPAGIPVGTLAIGAAGASNAALLAASILGASGKHPDVAVAYEKYRAKQTESVAEIPVDSPAHGTTEPAKHVPVSGSVVQDVIKQVSALTTSFPEKVLPPGSTIGIVGGGQLAKMIAIAAAYLGYKSHIYCPDKGSPAFQTCHEYTMADYLNKQSLCGFAAKCDVITYEFENVPKETIEFLQQYTPVRPDAHVLTISQNRMKEKTFVNSIGVPTTSFELVESHEQLKQATTKIGYPCILKSNTMGYDGKGQILIKEGDNLEQVWAKMLKMGGQSSILEGFVNFSCEVSVLVARTFAGKKSAFPVVENKHEHHILRETIAPAGVSDSIKKAAEDAALKIADGIGLIGLLAVEMFVTTDGKILVNELAPRPHNSGHWSIEGCSTSQFEQCVRSICGLPLGNVKILADKVVMKNLLGFEVNGWESYLNKENTHLHLYGKAEPREGRKMGHVTTLYYN